MNNFYLDPDSIWGMCSWLVIEPKTLWSRSTVLYSNRPGLKFLTRYSLFVTFPLTRHFAHEDHIVAHYQQKLLSRKLKGTAICCVTAAQSFLVQCTLWTFPEGRYLVNGIQSWSDDNLAMVLTGLKRSCVALLLQ